MDRVRFVRQVQNDSAQSGRFPLSYKKLLFHTAMTAELGISIDFGSAFLAEYGILLCEAFGGGMGNRCNRIRIDFSRGICDILQIFLVFILNIFLCTYRRFGYFGKKACHGTRNTRKETECGQKAADHEIVGFKIPKAGDDQNDSEQGECKATNANDF